jgi:thioredoxin 1
MTEEKKEFALHLDANEYRDKILKGSLPALVDFWAPWCFPCRMLAPTIEELAKEYEGRVVIAKVNTDQNGELANSLDIKGIPTMLFIKDGQIVDKMTGAAAKHIIAGKLQMLLEQSAKAA